LDDSLGIREELTSTSTDTPGKGFRCWRKTTSARGTRLTVRRSAGPWSGAATAGRLISCRRSPWATRPSGWRSTASRGSRSQHDLGRRADPIALSRRLARTALEHRQLSPRLLLGCTRDRPEARLPAHAAHPRHHGLHVIFWSQVARAGDQIDTTVNTDLIPPASRSPVAGDHPSFAFRGTSYWAQRPELRLGFHLVRWRRQEMRGIQMLRQSICRLCRTDGN